MNRDDFYDGSVGQITFDYYEGTITAKQYEKALKKIPKQKLVDCIMELQSHGLFEGFYHN